MAKPIPHSFVLDEIEKLNPITKPMFGCTAVYVGEKIVLILRSSEKNPRDNGVWLATSPEHHESLQTLFPNMRSLELFGEGQTKWQNLPDDADDFEEAALKACELVALHDPRIGIIPKSKLRSRVKSPKIKKPTRKKVTR